jgi:hypothetical protein
VVSTMSAPAKSMADGAFAHEARAAALCRLACSYTTTFSAPGYMHRIRLDRFSVLRIVSPGLRPHLISGSPSL